MSITVLILVVYLLLSAKIDSLNKTPEQKAEDSEVLWQVVKFLFLLPWYGVKAIYSLLKSPLLWALLFSVTAMYFCIQRNLLIGGPLMVVGLVCCLISDRSSNHRHLQD